MSQKMKIGHWAINASQRANYLNAFWQVHMFHSARRLLCILFDLRGMVI